MQHVSGHWVGAAEFAAVAGVGERSSRRILARAFEGKPWRGHALMVRRTKSRGAQGWTFQVRADTLPNAAAALPAVAPPVPVALPAIRSTPAPGSGIEARHAIIQPALQHPPGSAGRRAAVTSAAGISGKTESTIYRWIAAHEAAGLGALGNTSRADRYQRRTVITRAWDEAARAGGISDSDMARIAEETQRRIRSLWAANTEYGWRMIAHMARSHLAGLTAAAGFEGDARRLKAVCRLPHNVIMRERQYRAVAVYDQDAKRWHDHHRPRIQRTRDGRLPMDIVICDVHPMDVLLPRPDGSTFTAKLIAFEDWATARLFVHPVFLPKGEGVRQEHVAEAIVAMTQDPRWGVPQVFYLDNGGEYGCADLASDAMVLNTQIRMLGDDPELAQALRSRRREITKAQPYNAAAKAIEGTFNVVERGFFSMLPGWIGGNRMAKKTANIGRAPLPYPHGEAAFRQDLQNALDAYEARPQTGLLKGRSPRDAFAQAVDAGWRRMDVDRGAMLAAFARDESRMVKQGGFSYGGRRYSSRAIQALPAGTRLHLRVPVFGNRAEIPVMADDGSLLCMAEAQVLYDILDPVAAREAGRRVAVARAGIKALRADTEPLDMRRELAALATREPPAPVPESRGVIRLGKGMDAVGRELERTPAERRAIDDQDDQLAQERWRQTADRFLARTGTDG